MKAEERLYVITRKLVARRAEWMELFVCCVMVEDEGGGGKRREELGRGVGRCLGGRGEEKIDPTNLLDNSFGLKD